MTDPIPQRPWGQRLLVAVMVAVTIGITVLVAVNAYLLGQTTAEVQAAQAQSANVGNATRENLVLLQLVSQLGVTATPQQVAVQRGLLLRQIAVSIVSYPPGSAEGKELEGVRTAINKFPWGKLQQVEDRNEELRRACIPRLAVRAPRQRPAQRGGEAVLLGDQRVPERQPAQPGRAVRARGGSTGVGHHRRHRRDAPQPK